MLAQGGEQRTGIRQRRSLPGIEDLGVGMGRRQPIDLALEAHEEIRPTARGAEQCGHEGIQRATVVQPQTTLSPQNRPPSAASSSGTPVDTVFESVTRIALSLRGPRPPSLRALDERGGDHAVLRGDLVHDRPELGDLPRAVDEDLYVGRGWRGAEAIAEGSLVAGEPPFAAQRRDPARPRRSQAPRERRVEGATADLRGWRVYTRSAIQTGGSCVQDRGPSAAARAGRRRASRRRSARGWRSAGQDSREARSTRLRTSAAPTAMVAIGTLTLRLTGPRAGAGPVWIPSTPSSTVAPLAPSRRNRSTTARYAAMPPTALAAAAVDGQSAGRPTPAGNSAAPTSLPTATSECSIVTSPCR